MTQKIFCFLDSCFCIFSAKRCVCFIKDHVIPLAPAAIGFSSDSQPGGEPQLDRLHCLVESGARRCDGGAVAPTRERTLRTAAPRCDRSPLRDPDRFDPITAVGPAGISLRLTRHASRSSRLLRAHAAPPVSPHEPYAARHQHQHYHQVEAMEDLLEPRIVVPVVAQPHTHKRQRIAPRP
jgi:hypothetical protein